MRRDTIQNKISKKLHALFTLGGEEETYKLEKAIQSIIDRGEENGSLDQISGEMIQSVLDFRKTVVREVMVPRTEIVALPSDADIEEIITEIKAHRHTRMPVFENNIDNIIGILNVKDLLQFWDQPISEKDLIAKLRKPYYIPETKNIHLLLPELKQNKQHMAIVIDEYGGTSGLVTLEDLIEEIVGEISDEYDVEEQVMLDLPDGSVMADGRVEIEQLEDHLKIDIPDGKYETLAGFILHLIKKIPSPGEVIQYNLLEMTVDEADDRTIKKVRIRKRAIVEGESDHE